MWKYEFIYSRTDLKKRFKYENFVRQTDRPISEQKRDIYKLLDSGFDEELLSLIDEKDFRFNDNIVIQFESNGKTVLVNGIGSFPNHRLV